MMHDWNITRNYVVFMDLPIVSDMDLAATTGSPFGFKPECGARLGVMPRDGNNSDVRWFEIDPCFVFHSFNSFEVGNKIILYVSRQQEASCCLDTYKIILFPTSNELKLWKTKQGSISNHLTSELLPSLGITPSLAPHSGLKPNGDPVVAAKSISETIGRSINTT